MEASRGEAPAWRRSWGRPRSSRAWRARRSAPTERGWSWARCRKPECSDEHLGGGEDLGLGGQQGRLAGKQILGEAGDVGPEGAGEGEVGAEVEQGFLAHLAVLADGADEAEAVAGLAADEMGSGGPDEHED